MVAAVACSAAAGKNPWLPLALIFLLAAPSSVPGLLMDPDLHRQLHGMAAAELLWTLGGVFALLTIAESLADKVGFIEKWLVPVSTAWRPFAGIAVAALVGVAAAQDVTATQEAQALRAAALDVARADGGLLLGSSIVALTMTLAALSSWIATMGKTGTRLLMSLVPIPGLKLAHSFLDDFFALAASFAGLAFGHSALVVVLLALYLAVGLVTGPFLTRLTWIHVRIGFSLVRKGWRSMGDGAPTASTLPGWAQRWLEARGLTHAAALPAYVYRAPGLGWCRAGFLVLAPGHALFVTRVLFRVRAFEVSDASLARLGLAETATTRVITVVDRQSTGALRETNVYLFPAREDEVLGALRAGASRAGLTAVRADSESARRGLPGYADRGRSVRFLPAEDAGSLRLQGLVTIVVAVAVGILTGGVFVPIGAGYVLSPFKRRFVLGLLVSGYLSLCIVASMGLGWPAAVLYASVLNVLALRDLTRNALKARIDGYADRRAFLPLVASRVWVPAASVVDVGDVAVEGEEAQPTDGTWRAVVRLLREGAAAPAVPVAA
jgi:hypothetical protein